MTSQRPLDGLRVIEVSDRRTAAFCGRQFVMWGADVILFEATGGSLLRHLGPYWHARDAGGSVPFAFLAMGKRSVLADNLDFDDLLCRADVLILDASGAKRLGLQVKDLADRFPGLVVVHLSDFGLDPEPEDHDADISELQALTGYLALNGRSDEPPIMAPEGLLEHAIGANAFVGAMAALVRRRRSGRGGLVEVSGLESIAGLLPYLREQQLGVSSPRQGGTPEGGRLIRCLDGYVSVAPGVLAHLPAYRDTLGMSEAEAPDSLLEGGLGLAADRAAAAFAPFAARLAVKAVFLSLQKAGVVCGIVQPLASVLEDRQLAALQFFGETAFTEVGDMRVVGRSARLNGVGGPQTGPAPQLGSLSIEDLSWSVIPVRPDRVQALAPPLAGFMVLDLTQAWIGPMAGMILGDLGAEVIKVESPARPDVWRLVGQVDGGTNPSGSLLNRSCYFNAVNRNKLGLGLNLAVPAGAALFRKLAMQADIVLENFTPNIMARFGLDYANLTSANPGLVMTSFSGFGTVGPYAAFKANGVSIEALAGWDSLHCDSRGDPVLMASYPADPICGLQMAASTLVALYRRTLSGEGGHVEGSMFETAAEYIGDSLLAEALSRAGSEVSEPQRRAVIRGNDNTGFVLSTPSGRQVPVCDTLSALQHPKFSARKWFLRLPTPGLGERLHNGYFWRFHGRDHPASTPAPKLGEHTIDLLAKRLGLRDHQIQALIAEGTAGSVV